MVSRAGMRVWCAALSPGARGRPTHLDAIGARRFESQKAQVVPTVAVVGTGFLELRQTELHFGRLREFQQRVEGGSAAAWGQAHPSFLGMWTTDIGASAARIYHLYYWADYDERDAAAAVTARLKVEETPELFGGDLVASEASSIFAEATTTLKAAGLPGVLAFRPSLPGGEASAAPAYEMRTYQLRLGYTTVPRFLRLYEEGLVEKLAADTSGQSELVSLLHSEAGAAPLNTVVELWRHASLQGAQASRAASRGAATWRRAVGEIAELAVRFDTQLLRPIACGRLR